MKLTRTVQTDAATLGTLTNDAGEQEAITLELPWRDNQPGISCIPAGSYTCTRRFSPAHNRDLFWVDGVPDREAVELHVGNTVRDTKGCILIGTAAGIGGGELTITGSRHAFDRFMTRLEGVESFPLEIVDVHSEVVA